MTSGLQTRDDADDDRDTAGEAQEPAPRIHPSHHLVDGPPAECEGTGPCKERVGGGALNGELAREHGSHPKQDGQIGDMGDEDPAGSTITKEPVEDRAKLGSVHGHTSLAELLGGAFIDGSRRRVSHVPESGASQAARTSREGATGPPCGIGEGLGRRSRVKSPGVDHPRGHVELELPAAVIGRIALVHDWELDIHDHPAERFHDEAEAVEVDRDVP